MRYKKRYSHSKSSRRRRTGRRIKTYGASRGGIRL